MFRVIYKLNLMENIDFRRKGLNRLCFNTLQMPDRDLLSEDFCSPQIRLNNLGTFGIA